MSNTTISWKGKTAQPLARFRVYAWKSSLYFLVIVWRTQKEMLDARVRNGLPRIRDCQAHVFSFDSWRCEKGKPDRRLPIVGEIHFHKKRLGTEAITHETFHAAASLLRRLNFDFARVNYADVDSRSMSHSDDGEELVATVQGKMARAIVDRLYDLKLL